jgi:archaemetzincin
MRTSALEERKRALFDLRRFDETGHRRLGEPRPGEWLFHFEEAGQDDVDFRRECRNKRKRGRETIFVTELGEHSRRVASKRDVVSSFRTEFFALDVVQREPEPLPRRLYVREREQYDGDAIMDLTARSVPQNALASVAILDQDIFTEGLEFVFGLGHPARRVALLSLSRLADGATDLIFTRRCLWFVSHEVGHVLGLQHCVYYECIMNGTNSLDESDGKPLHLCPVCHSKLVWNVEFVDLERERALSSVLTREGLADDATWSARRVARLENAEA